MAGFSNYAEDLVLDWLFTTGSATRPTAWYVALYTVAPGESGGGTEVSGNGYERTAVTFSVSGTAPTLATNSGAVEFPAATANWGTIVAAAVFDAQTAGNMLAFGDLTTQKTIQSGDVLRFAAGEIDITLD